VPAKVIDSKRVIPDHIEKPDYWKTGHPRVNIGPQSQTVEVKSEEAIEKMRKSCFLAKEVLAAAMAKAKVMYGLMICKVMGVCGSSSN